MRFSIIPAINLGLPGGLFSSGLANKILYAPLQSPVPATNRAHLIIVVLITKTKLNSVALVRERTIPTERPPPVGEVSANICG